MTRATQKTAKTPERDGWVITSAGRQWKAVRREELNAWQLAHGCHAAIYADALAELETLLTAESIKDELISLGMSLAQGMRESFRTLEAARRRE